MSLLKSFKFWLLFLVALYSATGFLLLPWVITQKVPPILKEKLDLHVSIEKAFINPFNFEVTLDNIEIKDRKEAPAISLEQVFLDYDLIGLLERKILFKEFRISKPKLIAKLEKDGKINLNNLLQLPQSEPKVKTSKEETPLPLVYLEKFHIVMGELSFLDQRKENPFRLDLGPYDFSAHDISTEPGNINAHSFQTTLESGGELFWEGGMSLKPLKFYGELNLKQLSLAKLYKYALPEQKAHLQSAYLDLHLPYHVDLTKELKFRVQEAKLLLSHLRVANKASSKMLIDAPSIALNNISFAWPQQRAVIDSIVLNEPNIFANFSEKKELDLINTFLPPQSKEKEEEKRGDSKSEFSFLLKEFLIKKGGFEFSDNSLANPLKSSLSDISLELTQISSDKELPILAKLQTTLNEQTKLTLDGEFLQEGNKLQSSIKILDFRLAHYAPYIKPFSTVKLQKGSIDFSSDIKASLKEPLTLQALSNLKLNDILVNTADEKRLFSWDSLLVNDISYKHDPLALKVGSVGLHNPYVRFHIAKSGTTNFSNLLKEQEKTKKSEPAPQKESGPLDISIGPMKLTKGQSDFSDFSLPFPFKTKIHDLNGEISTLDFKTTKPSKVSMQGKIDKYGYTKISGDLLPFKVKKRADISVLFKNVNLPSFSPYSGKFVGYAIEKGKLSMDLKYGIENATLQGDNKINIDSLTLGEKIESPDAVNLPLELAIALLKDSKGQIDIDMPVKGDMNNPEFSYGGVIWRALGNLITGIVTAPFRFLGNMLGIDGEELKSIEFALGEAKLINTEHEKLANLEKIMAKRPQIKLTIQGGFNKVLDTKALQNSAFTEILQKTQKSLESKDKKRDTYALALKTLYLKAFSEKEYEELAKSFVDEKSEKLDITSLNTHIKTLLSERIEIPEQALVDLAQKRALIIQETLATKYKIEKSRVSLKEPIQTEAKRDKWIEVKLDITS